MQVQPPRPTHAAAAPAVLVGAGLTAGRAGGSGQAPGGQAGQAGAERPCPAPARRRTCWRRMSFSERGAIEAWPTIRGMRRTSERVCYLGSAEETHPYTSTSTHKATAEIQVQVYSSKTLSES